MDNVDQEQYFAEFDLSSEDLKLQILECSKNQRTTELANIQVINPSELPKLPYEDQTFELVLSAGVLFVDSEKLSEKDHLEAILELARVGSEVRIYPVTDNDGSPSVYLGPVIQALQLKGFGVELQQIKAAKNMPSNALLKLWQESCVLKNAQKVVSKTN